jgi:hypothetical protein
MRHLLLVDNGSRCKRLALCRPSNGNANRRHGANIKKGLSFAA